MKICNLEYLHTISHGNKGFITEVIQLFIVELPRDMLAIKSGIKDADWEIIHNSSHKIKPSIKMLGLEQNIQDIVSKINSNAKSKINLEEINSLFSTLEEKILLAISELEEVLKEME